MSSKTKYNQSGGKNNVNYRLSIDLIKLDRSEFIEVWLQVTYEENFRRFI